MQYIKGTSIFFSQFAILKLRINEVNGKQNCCSCDDGQHQKNLAYILNSCCILFHLPLTYILVLEYFHDEILPYN